METNDAYLAWLRSEIQLGLDDLDAGRVDEGDIAELCDELRRDFDEAGNLRRST